MNELKFTSPLRSAAILIILAICFMILSWAADVIVPLLFAVIFSAMLFPICFLLEKWGCHKGIAAFLSVLVAGMMSAAFLGINSSAYFSSTMSFTTNLLSQFLLILLFSFFLLYLRVFFLEFFYKVFPSSEKTLIDETMHKIYQVIQNYLLGLLKVIAIVGTLNSIGLWALGIESPLFFGFLGGLLVVIPYIGILIGSALPLIVALITKDSYWYAAGVMGVFLFVHILEGNVITPYVVGSKVSINPLVAIFSLLLFGKLWGLAGLVLALPVTAICKIIFDTLPGFKAVGFLLGKPQKYHFKRYSILHAKLRSRAVVAPVTTVEEVEPS